MINVYYHAYLTDDPGIWLGIVTEQLKCMEDSGLIPQVSKLKITAITQNDARTIVFTNLIQSYEFTKAEIEFVQNPYQNDMEMLTNLESDRTVTENHTMRKIWADCQENPDMQVLYLHTKGATAHINHLYRGNTTTYRRYLAWRHFLNWGVLERWNECWRAVIGDGGAHVAGVNYFNTPSRHFSGNFWWADGYHINELPDPSTKEWWRELKANTTDEWLKNVGDRFRDEQWVCSYPLTQVYQPITLDYHDNPAFKYLPRSKYGA